MTNGDLIRKVFPQVTDEDIAHIAVTCLPCFRCPIDGDQSKCPGPDKKCERAIRNYMKQEVSQ